MLNKTIVVMGPTGVGKSSFIRNAAPESDVQVGHHLHSETSQVQSIRWATRNGVGIDLVDTPGFDDSREGVTDADILLMIATFLTTQYQEKMSELTGFVYLHRISDTRVGGTSKRNLRMFQKLCGQDSFKNVVIVTTMWDKVMPEVGEQREQELKSSAELFKPLLDGGAVMTRHDGTQDSSNKVVEDLLEKKGIIARIVYELVIDKKNLVDTEAGMELQSKVRNVLQKHQEDLQRLEDEIREAVQQHDKKTEVGAAADRRRVEEDIARLHEELEKLGNSTSTKHVKRRRTLQKKRKPAETGIGQSTGIGGSNEQAGIGNSTGTTNIKRRRTLQKKRKPANASTCQAIEIGGTNKQAKMSSKSLPATTGGDFRHSDDANAHITRSLFRPQLAIKRLICARDHAHASPLEGQFSPWDIVPHQESDPTRGGIGAATHHDGDYPRTDASARPEADILNSLEVLSLVKKPQSQAFPTDDGVMESIIFRTTDFAMAVVCGIERARRGCSEAQSILSSRNVHDLSKFADELQQSMTKVHERLLRAQQGMKDAIQPTSQEIRTNRRRVPFVTPHYLAGKPIDANGKGIARSEDIIQAAQTAVDSMGGLVRWWAELIEMISQLKEDAVRVVAVSPTLDSKATATLESLIQDLDSHDRACRPSAYELCEMATELHQSISLVAQSQ